MTDILDLICTDEDLAALAGVSSRHVRRLGLPKTGRNQYRLGDAFGALLESLSGGDAGAALTHERVRLVKAQADKAELDLAKAKGAVCLIEEAARVWELRCGIIRQNILGVPARAILQLLRETDEAAWKAKLRAELVLALQQAAEAPITEADMDEEPTTDDETDDE